MKIVRIITIFLLVVFFVSSKDSYGKKATKKEIQPVLIDSASYLYKAGDIYLAGQPSGKNFMELKDKGLLLVINLRTDEEMKEVTANLYNEEELLKKEGIRYFHAPVGSTGYDPAVVDRIAEEIKSAGGKVMIHCRTAHRATMVWMAWLVRYQGLPINKAVKLGEMARYTFPFEEILGRKIKMK